jgi:uncharacterized protein YkwD
MRAPWVAASILFAVCSQAAASDLYQAINRLRAGDTTCAHAAGLQPLTPNTQLERAAAALASGGTLAKSVPAAGYRAARSTHISIAGETRESEALAILQRNYCRQLLDPAFTAIGIHQARGKLSIVLAAPFAPSVAESVETLARKTVALVNNARAVARKCGSRSFPAAGPVRWSEKLAQAAQLHADDMARFNYFSHDGRDGSKPAQRVARVGYPYRATGENIAAGPTTSEEVVADWIRSPGHCANLMNAAFNEMGVAFAVNKSSDLGAYWAQVFGTQR